MANINEKSNTKGRFVLVYSSIDRQPWSDDPFCMLIAQYLIRKVVYSECAYEFAGIQVSLKPGQFVTSLAELSDKARITATFKRFHSKNEKGSGKAATTKAVKRLIEDGFISAEVVGQGKNTATVFTVNNWVQAQAYSATPPATAPDTLQATVNDTQGNTQENTQADTQTNTPETQEQKGNEGGENTTTDTAPDTAENTQLDTTPATTPDTLPATAPDTVKQQEDLNNQIINNSISSEPKVSEPAEPVFIEFPLVGKAASPKSHGVTFSKIAEYAECYPIVDIEQSLREMKMWLIDNPAQRKTKKGIDRFINAWLSRNQNNRKTLRAIPGSVSNSHQSNAPAGVRTNDRARKLKEQFPGGATHG